MISTFVSILLVRDIMMIHWQVWTSDWSAPESSEREKINCPGRQAHRQTISAWAMTCLMELSKTVGTTCLTCLSVVPELLWSSYTRWKGWVKRTELRSSASRFGNPAKMSSLTVLLFCNSGCASWLCQAISLDFQQHKLMTCSFEFTVHKILFWIEDKTWQKI